MYFFSEYLTTTSKLILFQTTIERPPRSFNFRSNEIVSQQQGVLTFQGKSPVILNSSAKGIPILYFSYYSPPARGAYLVAKALNLDIELRDANILSKDYLTPELLKINPQHTIPTLKDGQFVIWDSHAIAGYLVGKYGTTDRLYPRDPERRAIVDQRLHFDTEILFPKTFATIYPLLFRSKTEVPFETKSGVTRVYRLLEKFLKDSTWLAGDEVTIADLCCVSSISSLDYLIPVSKFEHPKLYAFLERCARLPYYEDANQIGVDMLGSKIQERLITAYLRQMETAHHQMKGR